MNYRTLAILLAFIIAPFVNASEPSSSALDDWAPRLVDDDLMPSDAFVDGTAKWLQRAFAGEQSAATPSVGVRILVERQDYSRLRFNETCIAERFEFPNGVVYAKGLGTHANSRLRVVFPEPIARFDAYVGLTKAQTNGSVRFAVADASEKKLYESDVVRGGEDARKVALEFDPPISELLLLADTTEDGPYDLFVDGVRIFDYVIVSDYISDVSTDDNGNTTITNKQGYLGVLYHELGHYLGLPDYYDTVNSEEGDWLGYSVDLLSLMHSGAGTRTETVSTVLRILMHGAVITLNGSNRKRSPKTGATLFAARKMKRDIIPF